MVYKFFQKESALLNKSSGSGAVNKPNYQLANKLHKPIIGKFKKMKVHSVLEVIQYLGCLFS